MLYDELKRHLQDYLRRRIDLEQFENWFLPATWQITGNEDREAYELSSALRLFLAELDNGDLSEEQLREELARS